MDARVRERVALGDLAGALSLATQNAGVSAATLNAVARALIKAERPDEALSLLDRAVAGETGFGPAHFNRSRALKALGRVAEALESAQRSVKLQPDHAPGWNNLANILAVLGHADQADDAWARALALDPRQPTIQLNRARFAAQRGLEGEAAEFALAALAGLAASPGDLVEALGYVVEGGRSDAAEPVVRQMASDQPGSATTRLQWGMLLHRQGRHGEALRQYREAARLDRGCAAAFYNAGVIQSFTEPRDPVAAEACFRRVLALQPDNVPARLRLAQLSEERGLLAEALALTREVLQREASHLEALQLEAHLEARLCEWANRAERAASLASAHVASATADVPPLALNFFGADAPTLRAAARAYAAGLRRRCRDMAPLPPFVPRRPGRLRVGYLSQDLRHHAVGQLFHGVFASHDRERVEVHVYSLMDVDDAIQRSVRSGAEHFVSVAAEDPRSIAARIRRDEIDVLVDLGGFTGHGRPEVLVLRPAPVQLLHLGYLTTTAAPWYDGVIADAVVASDEVRAGFSEELLVMPECFAVASPLALRPEPFRRADFGLPDDRMVFCCLSRPLKIDPETFSAWMEILRAVPESVLWLFDDGQPRCRENLRAQAAVRGVDAARLHFAPQLPFADYLASYALADLFLDTFHYNACATAVGALHAGLPVLSRLGGTFLSRAGGSISRAAGTPSLVVESREDYVARAVALAADPSERHRLRDTVMARKGPLFDVTAHARGLEEIFQKMHEKNRNLS